MTQLPEERMWQSVVFTAFVDATRKDTDNKDLMTAKRDADRWIRGKGKDFRQVVSMAGMDPDFLHEAYVNGKVDADMLRSGDASHKGGAA